MSRNAILMSFKLILFTLLFYVFCAFQTSFWPFVFGPSFPPPQLWLITVIFVALKWPTTRAIFFIYFLGFIMTRFSFVQLKMVWTSLLALTLFVWFFKNRIHSTSLFYFAVLVTSGTFFYTLSYIVLSHWLEPIPTSVFFFHRLIEMGCNFILSVPVYKLLNFIDQRFHTTTQWNPSTADGYDEAST